VIVNTSPSIQLDFPQPVDYDQVHVVPLMGREHVMQPDCWCHPETDPEFPDMYVHNVEQ
jgi:hypothetical protein